MTDDLFDEPISIGDMIAELRRERAQRTAVYARLGGGEKVKARRDLQNRRLEAAIETLEKLLGAQG